MVVRHKKPWNTVCVVAPDGHTWLVGRAEVENDYAKFLVVADGLTVGHATEKVRSNECDFWFNEQYVLSEVVRDGTLIARPSYEQMTHPDYVRTNCLSECEITFLSI